MNEYLRLLEIIENAYNKTCHENDKCFECKMFDNKSQKCAIYAIEDMVMEDIEECLE